jgi:hypothetical protein
VKKETRKKIKKSIIIFMIFMMGYRIIEAMKSGDASSATHGNIFMIFLMTALAKLRHKEIEDETVEVDPDLIREYEKNNGTNPIAESSIDDDSQAS